MVKEKKFWIGLSLLNLSVVALFGLLMRSKMLFSIPELDYRNILSAHSHFAFGGWVGLALIMLLIYEVLPQPLALRKKYQAVLWGIEISSVGMALSFPFLGYGGLSIFFSSLYILVTYFFGWHFYKDMKAGGVNPIVKALSIGAIASLLLSSVGPFSLSYILISKSGNSLLYRDSIYTFLHFQYNGFFTLAIFAIFFSYWLKKGNPLPPTAKRFTQFLIASVLPTVFLALLWHNQVIFYVIAAIGCVFILLSIYYFLPLFRSILQKSFIRQLPLARLIWMMAFVSFMLKMVLTIGTIYPPLGNAVYGARPVIIGFLHLVFLAFVSFYILGQLLQEGFFMRYNRPVIFPFVLFGTGVVINEVFLMIQGLEMLLKTNNPLYNWILWGGAIFLFLGAVALAATFYKTLSYKKETTGKAVVQ
jgi:hypothetical protein